MNRDNNIRLSLPSQGRLSQAALDFLAACGLGVDKPNPRQYAASIPALPEIAVLFQRPGDIVVSVRDGSIDFGITGMDVVAERRGENGAVLVLHEALNFGQCRLCLAVPEEWAEVHTLDDLAAYARALSRPLRAATRFRRLTDEFLTRHAITPFVIIEAEGTLEVAPTIGYADIISDLVSSGQTLRDNRLRPLEDGTILHSQAALIANKAALKSRPETLAVARKLLESFEAHLRAVGHVAVFANMRGESPQEIARRMFTQETLGGLSGPTVSPVITRDENPNWYAIHVIVRREKLLRAVAELRAIGGSGVVVTPVTYIFEEEPTHYRAMMEALQEGR